MTIHQYLSDDHARLDALLARVTADPDRIDDAAYREFRAGLLRHIAMEEKVLFPHARAQDDEAIRRLVRVLHADHAAIACLLVPPPTRALIETLHRVLDEHNPLEDAPAGIYAYCDRTAGDGADALVERMQAIPGVRAAEHVDDARVHEHIDRMLAARELARASDD